VVLSIREIGAIAMNDEQTKNMKLDVQIAVRIERENAAAKELDKFNEECCSRSWKQTVDDSPTPKDLQRIHELDEFIKDCGSRRKRPFIAGSSMSHSDMQRLEEADAFFYDCLSHRKRVLFDREQFLEMNNPNYLEWREEAGKEEKSVIEAMSTSSKWGVDAGVSIITKKLRVLKIE